MQNPTQAAAALDKLPTGSQVAAAFIDENDATATIVLFEHRQRDDGTRQWWDLTRRQVWWTSADIAKAFDDMVITARPETDSPTTKMTGRLRFRYADGSYLEWSTKEPTTPAHIRETIDKFADLGFEPKVIAAAEAVGEGRP